jgi:hypothetical protein
MAYSSRALMLVSVFWFPAAAGCAWKPSPATLKITTHTSLVCALYWRSILARKEQKGSVLSNESNHFLNVHSSLLERSGLLIPGQPFSTNRHAAISSPAGREFFFIQFRKMTRRTRALFNGIVVSTIRRHSLGHGHFRLYNYDYVCHYAYRKSFLQSQPEFTNS